VVCCPPMHISNQTKSEAFWAFPLAAAENQNQTKLAKLP